MSVPKLKLCDDDIIIHAFDVLPKLLIINAANFVSV